MFPQPPGMTEQLLAKLPGFVMRSHIKQSENSHFVNVFTPGDMRKDEKLPVMVRRCSLTRKLTRGRANLSRSILRFTGFHLVKPLSTLLLTLFRPRADIEIDIVAVVPSIRDLPTDTFTIPRRLFVLNPQNLSAASSSRQTIVLTYSGSLLQRIYRRQIQRGKVEITGSTMR